ncbi:hypothetical protein HC028_01200 [Planosporangium flavigriseum]|uniref:YrhB domain-containing protein n=1 Tax=Planosporangium flavigriseum TaxID=373681 RepID=UPI00143C195C|nr:hypothetical protein [Planosporangium flavigriseum]
MIDRNEAHRIAVAQLELIPTRWLPPGDTLMLVENATLEFPKGWVFFYQSRLYLQTGEFSHKLLGNRPFLVKRFDGEVCWLPILKPIEESVSEVN